MVVLDGDGSPHRAAGQVEQGEAGGSGRFDGGRGGGGVGKHAQRQGAGRSRTGGGGHAVAGTVAEQAAGFQSDEQLGGPVEVGGGQAEVRVGAGAQPGGFAPVSPRGL